MSPDNSVTHVPGLHQLLSNNALDRTEHHRGPRLTAAIVGGRPLDSVVRHHRGAMCLLSQ